MEAVLRRLPFFRSTKTKRNEGKTATNLADGRVDVIYTVKEIKTDDQEMKDFLFTLGCYKDEEVTIISRLAGNVVISVKDARYSINTELAKVIMV